MKAPNPYTPPYRLLMGPGPSNSAPSVLASMANPVVSPSDPALTELLEQSKAMLQEVFQTRNEMTLPLSGTGRAALEFCLSNLLEPGDEILVGVNGYFGAQIAELAGRLGARVQTIHAPWGQALAAEQFGEALKQCRPKVVAMVHAETSTGALSPVEDIARLAHASGALLLLDTVTSLGGCPVHLDHWQVDVAYSSAHRCLSCPPGLSLVSFGERGLEAVRQRKSPLQSRYFDFEQLHQPASAVSAHYALHEALRLVLEEGLENRWERQRQAHLLLQRGLEAMKLKLLTRDEARLWQMNLVGVPPGVDAALVRSRLLDEYNIEVGAGLGPFEGKAWRVGLMGETATHQNLSTFLVALAKILTELGLRLNLEAVLEVTLQGPATPVRIERLSLAAPLEAPPYPTHT